MANDSSSWETMMTRRCVENVGEQSYDFIDRNLSDVADSADNGSCVTGGNTDDDESVNPFILPWYFRVGYAVAFVAMVTVAAGGNTGVVWIVVTHRRMRTVTNYFLVNLAVADALMSIFNTMFNFVFMLYSDWPFGRTYCKFTQFIAPCTIAASVFTFIAIAIDR
jgi:tachykinin receptor 3